MQQFESFPTNVSIVGITCLQVVLLTVLWFKWSARKHCVAKLLPAMRELLLHENNHNYNSYRFSYKFAFILALSFLTNQKQQSCFQQVGGLVTTTSFVFVFSSFALYFKAMLNSIDFYKGIFSHVVPVRIIVPWFHSWHTNYTTTAFVICRKVTNGKVDEFKC